MIWETAPEADICDEPRNALAPVRETDPLVLSMASATSAAALNRLRVLPVESEVVASNKAARPCPRVA